ncbi:hypothetical protein C0J52_23736, partial [Blattella germanica]
VLVVVLLPLQYYYYSTTNTTTTTSTNTNTFYFSFEIAGACCVQGTAACLNVDKETTLQELPLIEIIMLLHQRHYIAITSVLTTPSSVDFTLQRKDFYDMSFDNHKKCLVQFWTSRGLQKFYLLDIAIVVLKGSLATLRNHLFVISLFI